MPNHPASSLVPSALNRVAVLVLLLLTVGLSTIAITNQSLWIDEANTAKKALAPTIFEWRRLMHTERGSDVQMPFYMGYAWVWNRVAGVRPEWLFRFSNVFWMLLGQAAMLAALRNRPRMATAQALVLALNPFLWYYLNEARPYLMQFAAAELTLAFFVRAAVNSKPPGAGWHVAFGCGLLLLAGSSMLGVLWVGCFLPLWVVLLWSGRLPFRPQNVLPVGVAVLLMLPLGIYYAGTLMHKAKPTEGETGVMNIAFALYELLGIGGLRPSRGALRSGGMHALTPMLPVIGLLALGEALVFWNALKGRLREPLWTGIAAATLVPAALVVVFGHATHARVLGRHLTPVEPLVALMLAAGILRLWDKKAAGRIVCGVFLLLFAASAFSFRFAAHHAKENNRAVLKAEGAALATGAEVWWVGDDSLADYYGVPVREIDANSTAKAALLIRNPAPADLRKLPQPQLVGLLRPDVYDTHSAVQDYLKQHDYRREAVFGDVSLWSRR